MAGGGNVKLSSAIKRGNFLLLYTFHMSTSLFIPPSLYNRLYKLLSHPSTKQSNYTDSRILHVHLYTHSLFLAQCFVSLLLVTMDLWSDNNGTSLAH